MAIPIDAVTCTSSPAMSNGAVNELSMWSAILIASVAARSFSHTTTNSSPLKRPTVSSAREALLQFVGDSSQYRVAETVAPRVVEDLEPVHVHKEHADRPVPARGQRQAVLDPVHDQHPVRQLGEGIVKDLVLEPQFC